MGKQNAAKFFKDAQLVISRHSPEILTGIGIAGMVTTTVLAVRATPKALKLIEAEKEKEQIDKLTAAETVKATWKCYIPAAVTGVTSIACLIGASSVNARRNAALATAYKLSETALDEYKEKVIETIGEKKEKTVREKVDEKQLEKHPLNRSEVIITQKGSTLCFDYYSSRYFESDIEEFNKAINRINSALIRDEYVTLNELYDELGLEHTGVGDILGWNLGRLGRNMVQPCISSHIAHDKEHEGQPCIVMSCDPPPSHDYANYR